MKKEKDEEMDRIPVYSTECSLLRAGGFSCSLDVFLIKKLLLILKICFVQIRIFSHHKSRIQGKNTLDTGSLIRIRDIDTEGIKYFDIGLWTVVVLYLFRAGNNLNTYRNLTSAFYRA
jgi:hypothetical protein